MRTFFAAYLFTTVLTSANSIMAHGEMKSSVPAPKAVIHAPRYALELTFDHPSELTAVMLKIGDAMILVDLDRSAPEAKIVPTNLPDLASGMYSVDFVCSAITAIPDRRCRRADI